MKQTHAHIVITVTPPSNRTAQPARAAKFHENHIQNVIAIHPHLFWSPLRYLQFYMPEKDNKVNRHFKDRHR